MKMNCLMLDFVYWFTFVLVNTSLNLFDVFLLDVSIFYYNGKTQKCMMIFFC